MSGSLKPGGGTVGNGGSGGRAEASMIPGTGEGTAARFVAGGAVSFAGEAPASDGGGLCGTYTVGEFGTDSDFETHRACTSTRETEHINAAKRTMCPPSRTLGIMTHGSVLFTKTHRSRAVSVSAVRP